MSQFISKIVIMQSDVSDGPIMVGDNAVYIFGKCLNLPFQFKEREKIDCPMM